MQAFFAHFQVPAYAYRAAPEMVTPEELRLVRTFRSGEPFDTAAAAERLSLSQEAAQALLQAAYGRSVVNKTDNGWAVTDFYTRFFAFCREQPEAWRAMDRSVRATLSEWALEEYAVKMRLHAAEPVRRDVVLTPEEAVALVRGQTAVGVAPCVCSSVFDVDSAAPETCFSFGDGPNTELDRGVARRIDPEEAAARVRSLYESGRILTQHGEDGLCACQAACCLAYHAAERTGMLTEWPESPRIALPGPGEAEQAQRCPLQALTAQEGQLVPQQRRCVGCGLCGLLLTDR